MNAKTLGVVAVVLLGAGYFLFFRGPSRTDTEQAAQLFADAFCETGILDDFGSVNMFSNTGALAGAMQRMSATFSGYLTEKRVEKRQIQVIRKVASGNKKNLELFGLSVAGRMSASCPDKATDQVRLGLAAGMLLGIVKQFPAYDSIGI